MFLDALVLPRFYIVPAKTLHILRSLGFRSDFLISLIPFFSTFFSQWQIILPLVHKLIKLSREAIFSYCINHLAPQIHFRFFPVSSSFDAKVTSQIFQISYLVSTTYLNCKLKGREIDCFNMQGPLGSFNGHTPLWRPFFLGVLWLVISVKGRGVRPLQAVQAKPKTPLPKFTSQKGMECDWTGEKKISISNVQIPFHTISTHNHWIYHFAKSLMTQF